MLNAEQELSRENAIARLREKLMNLTDDDHSVCDVAARSGFLCRGFRRYTDEQLRERYAWLQQKYPPMNRQELEELANKWQLARQIVHDVPLACDAQTMEHHTCGGWDDFSNEELARHCEEMLGLQVTVR